MSDHERDSGFMVFAQFLIGAVAVSAATLYGIYLIKMKFGKHLSIKYEKDLSETTRKQLGGHNTVILGSHSTGKTALIWFMESGKPYKGEGASKSVPDHTIASVVISKDFNINKDKWAKIPKDVAGERTDLWAAIIEEVRPTGVIYMINPLGAESAATVEKLKANISKEFEKIQTHVFDVCRHSGIPVKSFHVFLNFADRWDDDEGAIGDDLASYTLSGIKALLRTGGSMPNLRVETSVTQLDPDRFEWVSAERAIDRFGADLGRVKI